MVLAAAAVLASFGCSDGGEDEACDELRQAHVDRSAEAEDLLDDLLEYRAAVSLHDRTHHDLQFEYAKAVVEREAARGALDDAGCERG